MEKKQLDNLLRFCFCFHRSMGCDVAKQHPDYILEKWNKYIGIEISTIKDIVSDNSDLTSYFDKIVNNWISLWGENNTNTKIREIVKFICKLNTKSLNTNIGDVPNFWIPSEIANEFKLIGDPSKINKDPYVHLHPLVNIKLDEWLDYVVNKRDYKLYTLI